MNIDTLIIINNILLLHSNNCYVKGVNVTLHVNCLSCIVLKLYGAFHNALRDYNVRNHGEPYKTLCIIHSVFPKLLRSRTLFFSSKNDHRSSHLAHVSIYCRDERCPKFKIYISDMNLNSHENIPAAYVTIYCMT
jgi:hypothetical protein